MVLKKEGQCTIPFMAFQNKPEIKTCGRCGKTFECHSHSGGCWCEKLPPLPKLSSGADCLCADCLKKEIENQKSLKP